MSGWVSCSLLLSCKGAGTSDLFVSFAWFCLVGPAAVPQIMKKTNRIWRKNITAELFRLELGPMTIEKCSKKKENECTYACNA